MCAYAAHPSETIWDPVRIYLLIYLHRIPSGRIGIAPCDISGEENSSRQSPQQSEFHRRVDPRSQ